MFSFDWVKCCSILELKCSHLGDGGDWSLLFFSKTFSQPFLCISSSFRWAGREIRGYVDFFCSSTFLFFFFFFWWRHSDWYLPEWQSSLNLDAVAGSEDEHNFNTASKKHELEWRFDLFIYSCESRKTELSRSKVPGIIPSYSHQLFTGAEQTCLFLYWTILMVTENPCPWKLGSKQQNFGL